MIAIISDLHLQHTRLDVIRHRDGEDVWETGVRRNVSADAVDLLFDELEDVVTRRRCERVELVLAGDVFECHRTPLWFCGDDAHVRPTDASGPDGSPLCVKLARVLDAVEEENDAFFRALRAGIARGVHGVPVLVHFLPGNHDRLVNLWPSVRARVRAILGLAPSDAPFPHVLDWPRDGGGEGVRVRHGHEFDPPNIGTRDGALDYDAPALGDFVTVDIAARLATAFRVRHASGLRAPGPDGDRLRALYVALAEFDDVRPATRLGHYLALRGEAHNAAIFSMLRPVLLDVYAAATSDAFFARGARARGIGPLFTGPLATLLRAGIRELPATFLAQAVRDLSRLDDRHDSPALARGAAREDGLGTRFDIVVAGHTHQPGMTPIGPAAWFVNSGTWRDRVDVGVVNYGRVRSCTMVYCFDPVEAACSPDRRRVETWTGSIAADVIGPYTARVPGVSGPERRVAAKEIEVLAVRGGRSGEGAELRLELGVDGTSVSFVLEGVHDGDRVPLALDPLPLDPALDGEVWVRTSEDRASWGVDFAGASGPRVLSVTGYDHDGRLRPSLRLRYDVT